MFDSDLYRVIIITGVSGTGKSTIGRLLSDRLDIPFFDGDDYHPKKNIEKMQKGNPLDDDDRVIWLQEIGKMAKEQLLKSSCIIACSALKQKYRDQLSIDINKRTVWVYLFGSYRLILKRMQERSNHFMPAKLLKSQFDILEKPKGSINIRIDKSPKEIVNKIEKEI